MIHVFKLDLKYLMLLLLALSAVVFMCGILGTGFTAEEIPPGVMITEGKTRQGFPYISGGVSSDEREVIDKLGKAYNVRLIFAEKRGAYLSDVRLVIETANGAEVISITTNGPLFYIQLPPGSYEVKASFNRVTKAIKRLEVPQYKRVQQVLTWDLGEPSEKIGHDDRFEAY